MTTVIEFPNKSGILWEAFEQRVNAIDYLDEEAKKCVTQRLKRLFEKYNEETFWGPFTLELKGIGLSPTLTEEYEREIMARVKKSLIKYLRAIIGIITDDVMAAQIEICKLEEKLSKRSDRN